MAFLIPSGLHAKQFVEFCMTEFAKTAPVEMAEDHSCCESNPLDHESTSHSHHDDCEWGWICACNIGKSALSDSDWIVSGKELEIELSEQENFATPSTLSEQADISQNRILAQYDPPLWLVYDTFLN